VLTAADDPEHLRAFDPFTEKPQRASTGLPLALEGARRGGRVSHDRLPRLPELPSGYSGTLNGVLGGIDLGHAGVAISGEVVQEGASGGTVSGWWDPAGLHLTIGDLLRPLSGSTIEVHPGGQLDLHR